MTGYGGVKDVLSAPTAEQWRLQQPGRETASPNEGQAMAVKSGYYQLSFFGVQKEA